MGVGALFVAAVTVLGCLPGFVSNPSQADVLPYYTFTGRVLDASGTPVTGVTVAWSIQGGLDNPTSGSSQAATTGKSGTFSLRMQGPSSTQNATEQATLTMPSGTSEAYSGSLSTNLSIGDVSIPADTSEMDEYRFVDKNGDPVPNLDFGYTPATMTTGTDCNTSTASTAGVTLRWACAWQNAYPSAVTGPQGSFYVASQPHLSASTIDATYTDQHGVHHSYHGPVTVTRNPEGTIPAEVLTYQMSDVDIIPPPPPAHLTVSAVRCGRISVSWLVSADSPTLVGLSVTPPDGTTLPPYMPVNSGTGHALLTAPVRGVTYADCGGAVGFAPGRYTVSAYGYDPQNGESKPLPPVTVRVGDLPLTTPTRAFVFWPVGSRAADVRVTPGDRSLKLTWPKLPATVPATAKLTVKVTTGSGRSESKTLPYTATTALFTGLTSQRFYRVHVTATNAVATVSRVVRARQPRGFYVSGPPTRVLVCAAHTAHTITLYFGHSRSGGTPITRFRITGARTAITRARHHTFRGLKPGTYRFHVAAGNKYGYGPTRTVRVTIR